MHKNAPIALFLALAAVLPSIASADDPPTGPLPATMRASFCAQLRGLDWQNSGDRAIASCVFTGNAASPVSCGLRLGHHNGVYLAADTETAWLPDEHESTVIDRDAMNALLRVERRLRQRQEVSMRARTMAVEHAYYRAAASIVRTKRPDLAARARVLSASAEQAAQDYLETSQTVDSLLAVPLAPIEHCPDVLAGLMRPIEREREAARTAEARRVTAHAEAESLLARLLALPENSSERDDLLRRYRSARRREYEPQIAAARARAAELEAAARRYPSAETHRRLAELERLRLAVDAAPESGREAALRAYQQAMARERRRPLTAHERAYFDFAEARQAWLATNAVELMVRADEDFVRNRERGRQRVRDLHMAALVPGEAIVQPGRSIRGASYVTEDIGWAGHQALGATIQAPGRALDATLDGIGGTWRAAWRRQTWVDMGEGASEAMDNTVSSLNGIGAWTMERVAFFNLSSEQQQAVLAADGARHVRDLRGAADASMREAFRLMRAASGQYELAARRGDRRAAIVNTTAEPLTPRDPREALRGAAR